MLRPRVIPVLLLRGGGLVKSVKFKNHRYVGDPLNAVRIFNEKEVDELVFLDISATSEKCSPTYDLISRIAAECFMPFAYGGGVRSIDHVRTLVSLGVEKVVINSRAVENSQFVREAADLTGSQSIVVSIDVKKDLFGRYRTFTECGRRATGRSPVELAEEMEALGAGEILLTSIDRDGTMQGYDLELVRRVTSKVTVPVVACGGAGTLDHLKDALMLGGASAAAAGSMFLYHGRHRAVLINYPAPDEIEHLISVEHADDDGA